MRNPTLSKRVGTFYATKKGLFLHKRIPSATTFLGEPLEMSIFNGDLTVVNIDYDLVRCKYWQILLSPVLFCNYLFCNYKTHSWTKQKIAFMWVTMLLLGTYLSLSKTSLTPWSFVFAKGVPVLWVRLAEWRVRRLKRPLLDSLESRNTYFKPKNKTWSIYQSIVYKKFSTIPLKDRTK